MNKPRLEEVVDTRTGLPVIAPGTGELQKREVSNRRAGYGLTFSVPKSVPLYLAVNEDKVVEQMIAEALDQTMATIEPRMETKVRKGYQQDNRISPNMVYAKFVHGETRPVDGIPNPHYHIHVFAMNATFDEVEKNGKPWKWETRWAIALSTRPTFTMCWQQSSKSPVTAFAGLNTTLSSLA